MDPVTLGMAKADAAKRYALKPAPGEIIWLGDSRVEPGTSIAELVRLQKVRVTNGGKSGQSSTEVAIRQGGIVPVVTVTGGTIPASGPVAVNVISPTGAFKSNVQGAMANPEYLGTIAGVPGKLVANIQGTPRTWSFTRSTPGTAVTVTGQFYFISTEGPLHAGKEQIWEVGRNFSGDLVITDEQAMLEFLKKHVATPKYIPIEVTTSETETVGTAEYNAVQARNATRKAIHGKNHLGIRRPLIDRALWDLGITPTAGDLADIAGDTVPRSLRVDSYHLTGAADKWKGAEMAKHRTRIGYYVDGPVPADPYALHPISKTSGLIKRYAAKTLSDSQVGTAIASLLSIAPGADVTDFLRPVVTGSGATYRKADGMAYLSFDGVDDRMFIPAFTQADPFTLAVVYRLRSTGTLKTIASLNNSFPVTATQLARTADGSITFDGLTRDAPYSGTGWRVGFLSSNGAGSVVGLDGAYITGPMGGADIGGFRLGEGVGTYSDIDVAEALLWNTALTADEIRVLRNDLAVGHPGLF